MVDVLINSDTFYVLSLIGTLLAIPSFAFSVITWYKGKKKKQLRCARAQYPMITNPLNISQNLSINTKDNNDISITRLAIWNGGNIEILSNDIAQMAPLIVFCSDDAELLSVDIQYKSNPAMSCSAILQNKQEALIGFDYFNPKDVIVLEITHIGASSCIDAYCKIIGGLPFVPTVVPNKYSTFVYRAIDLLISFLFFLAFIIFFHGAATKSFAILIYNEVTTAYNYQMVLLVFLINLATFILAFKNDPLFKTFKIPHSIMKRVSVRANS